MSKMAIIAKLTAQSGRRDDLISGLSSLFDVVEGEPGTEVYALHKDLGDDDVVWFYELYTDADAATVHGSSEAMKAAGAVFAELLSGRAELSFLAPERAKGLTF